MESKINRDRKLAVCRACEKYTPATTQCKECGCVMTLKVWIKGNQCPLGKHQ